MTISTRKAFRRYRSRSPVRPLKSDHHDKSVYQTTPRVSFASAALVVIVGVCAIKLVWLYVKSL